MIRDKKTNLWPTATTEVVRGISRGTGSGCVVVQVPECTVEWDCNGGLGRTATNRVLARAH